MIARVLTLLSCLITLIACSPPPVQRPLEGAPVRGTAAPGAVATVEAPPPTLTGTQGGGATLRPAAATPSPSPSPLPGPPWVVAATGGRGANLREQPNTTARVIATLAEGTPVELLDQPTTIGGVAWRRVRAGGRDGWIVAGAVHPR